MSASVPTAVYPIEAYSYASRFVLRDAAHCFPAGATVSATKTQLVVRFQDEAVVYAFDFGALVFVNVTEDVRSAIVASFARLLPREPHPPLRESFLVELRPGSRIEIEMAFDRVVVPVFSQNAVEVVATVLAQSVSIDYYDEDAQLILNRIATIANEVAKQGRPRGRHRDLLRFAGASMAFQAEIIGAISLLDKPDLTWEDELADRIHERLRYHFEIAERYRALEAKLRTIRETLQTLTELSSERRMFFLEVAVVALIVIEVAVGMLQIH